MVAQAWERRATEQSPAAGDLFRDASTAVWVDRRPQIRLAAHGADPPAARSCGHSGRTPVPTPQKPRPEPPAASGKGAREMIHLSFVTGLGAAIVGLIVVVISVVVVGLALRSAA